MTLQIDRIQHVAYRCRDAKETVLWYGQMLKMGFVAGRGNVLAFFELPTREPMGRDQNTPTWVQHIAFEVESLEALESTRQRLIARGIEVVGPTDHGLFRSIYFFDPNGHRLELACDIGTEEQYAELKRVAPPMLDDWSKTKTAPRHAEWLHKEPIEASE